MFNAIRLKDGDNQYDIVPRNDMLHKLEIDKINFSAVEGEIVNGAQIFSNYQNYKRKYTSEVPTGGVSSSLIQDTINSPYILLTLTCQAKWGNSLPAVTLTLKLDQAYSSSSIGGYISFVGYKNAIFSSDDTMPILDAMIYAYITNINTTDALSFNFESALSTKTEFTEFNIISVDDVFVPNISGYTNPNYNNL